MNGLGSQEYQNTVLTRRNIKMNGLGSQEYQNTVLTLRNIKMNGLGSQEYQNMVLVRKNIKMNGYKSLTERQPPIRRVLRPKFAASSWTLHSPGLNL